MEHQIIGALGIDQRGALKRMIGKHQSEAVTSAQIEDFKKIVSSELTPFTSSILLDPEYGLPAAEVREEKDGLLLAYEKTRIRFIDSGSITRSIDRMVCQTDKRSWRRCL